MAIINKKQWLSAFHYNWTPIFVPIYRRGSKTLVRKMATVFSSSTLFFAPPPLHGLSDANPRFTPSPAVAFLGVSARTPSGLLKSSYANGGSKLQSSQFGGLWSKRSGTVVCATAATEKSVHDFTVKDIDGKDVPLSKFKGKVLLIVNVASRCGLTTSNYSELTHIYEKYKPQGLEILAFPCNQFGGQEPGTNADIKQFACTKFKAEFPIFDKVEVNGPNTAPIYKFLKSSAGGFLGDVVKWNFEKFLADKSGKVVERYPPTTSPFQIEKDIQKLLAT